jgi:hypothetical protein
MTQLFLCPRYRLDDESPWLEGIDPARHYWIAINGNSSMTQPIPGLMVESTSEWKQAIRQFRAMQAGEEMKINRVVSSCTIHRIGENCYAIASEINKAPIWHLFDQETLESLLRTAHPDWQCTSNDVDLGRKLLLRSLEQPAASKLV